MEVLDAEEWTRIQRAYEEIAIGSVTKVHRDNLVVYLVPGKTPSIRIDISGTPSGPTYMS